MPKLVYEDNIFILKSSEPNDLDHIFIVEDNLYEKIEK